MSRNRQWIELTLSHQETEAIPYNFGFTPPARRLLENHYGRADLEDVFVLVPQYEVIKKLAVTLGHIPVAPDAPAGVQKYLHFGVVYRGLLLPAGRLSRAQMAQQQSQNHNHRHSDCHCWVFIIIANL